AHYTDSSPRARTEAQALAFSLDGGSTWTRHAGNPVLELGVQDFRDPKVFWWGDAGGHWVMATVDPPGRRVLLFTSPDLRTWTAASSFGPAGAVDGIWECPDLFPLTVAGTGETRWVLVLSLNPGAIAGGSGGQYFVGDFDGTVFTPDPRGDGIAWDWLDFGRDLYAAVSFGGVAGGRRLLLGWGSNWDYAMALPRRGWSSAMSFVRELGLVRDDDGHHRLVQRPVVPLDDPALAVAELTVPVAPGRATDVVVSTPDGADRVVVTVDGDRRELRCDRRASGNVEFHPAFASVDVAPLPPGDTTDLLVIADASVVEVYAAGGRVTMVEQVLPGAPLSVIHVVEAR
ncbi:MAG: glycoside hydrolase family 32 protein, partial [Actinomycetes bacterium]|nr:glycoside hydrolase family 32 protein [Actinomycetes bacterium]MDX5381297.1 glycoside hydrolase family 32 protein [Actinomycetes bacterium]MDX5400675.1 glycoside hydrolase family 32 protein [Actinomycetes bacterium]MDX5451071.1 glycoside hydrolase family 32 protein [Actinomycetes bacterium]